MSTLSGVLPEISARRRLAGTGVAFGFLYLASPGIAFPDGAWWLALAAVATWARYASAPGRGAVWVEIATAGVAWAGICSWAAHVWWGTLVVLGPGHGLYFAAQGWLLRRFARRFPLALAAPLAWILVESVRASLEPPFGIQWMRLGTHLHDQAWIAGSARVWGVGGLSLVLAALGGLAADLWIAATAAPEARRPVRLVAWISGLAPIAVGGVLTLVVPPPATRQGPRVLLVQPAIPQERKMQGPSWEELVAEQIDLTRRAVEDTRASGEPLDLVAWGESMLLLDICDPALLAEIEAGARSDPWAPELDAGNVRVLASWERELVDGVLFGTGPYDAVIPEGTAFAAGAEHMTAHAGRIRRQGSYFLWPGPGQPRQGPASKRHLVPGAETMLGLERFEWVRDAIFALAGYVPDLLGASGPPPAFELAARDGRRYRFAGSICFDNAFDDVFADPARAPGVDFHLVASNEAWFHESQELDQMVAFSRLAAIATGRTVVRATNSGITCAIAPDGREIGRVRSGGRDRSVPGWLAVVVPVPVEPEARTPFVRRGGAWLALWILAPLALLASELRRRALPLAA